MTEPIKIVTCIDTGHELGLTVGATYEVVRTIDRWTVAVRSTERPEVSPEFMLDTWQHADWPEAEVLTPRMAGRFSPRIAPDK